MTKPDTYQIITDRIIEKMEAGDIPWHKPWATGLNGGVAPANFISKRPYRGVNILMTMLAGYDQPYWLTFNQAKSLGGNIRKGEKGTPVVLWKFLNKPNAEGEDERIPLIRYYTVFNVEQTEGIEIPALPSASDRVIEPDAAADAVVADFMARHPMLTLQHGGGRACYSPLADTIRMPQRSAFDSTAAYYQTLFHELVHATGSSDRLKRDLKGLSMDKESYSFEELVAEIGAAFLMHAVGLEVEPTENTAAYLRSWLKELRRDKKAIVQAAAKAQRAVDLILGTPAYEEAGDPVQQEAA